MDACARNEDPTARRGRTSQSQPAGLRMSLNLAGPLMAGLVVMAATVGRGESTSWQFEASPEAAAVAEDHDDGLHSMNAAGHDGTDFADFLAGHDGRVFDVGMLQGGVCGACPRWTVQVDALMLWQGGVASRPLYLDAASRAVALDANDFGTPVSVGPRYAVIFNRDACRSLEVNYFDVWGFAGTGQAVANGGPLQMNNLAGLDLGGIAGAEARSQAYIKSFEVNMRQISWGGIRWLQGFRWVEWGQQLALADMGGGGAGSLDVTTRNNLYGWQWGADATLWNRGGRLRVNGIGKAGVFGNGDVTQTTVFESPGRGGAVTGITSNLAFFGEAGVTGTYSLTDWLAWRAGYTCFWLAGVATPENQLAVTNVGAARPRAQVNPWGSAMLHGVTTGLEARW
jgi:hypothetical protein